MGTALAELNGKVITVEGTLKARRKENDSLQRDLRELEVELLEVEDDLKTLGAVDPEELEKAQSRRSELTEAKAKLEAKLTDAWEAALPISLLGSYRKEFYDYLASEERRREWESARSAVEPKIPQVKQDVFDDVPKAFTLKEDVEAFFMKRLEDALHRLFYPPPEGIPERVYATTRTDVSVKIRNQLQSGTASLRDLSDAVFDIERMDIEWRELDQRLRQMQQNAAAFKRGSELHHKRGTLVERRDQITKRLKEVEGEIARMEVELTDLKRQESIQQEIADKAERGENLAAMAMRYRDAAGEIRNRAAGNCPAHS